jgi:hypothetical protein
LLEKLLANQGQQQAIDEKRLALAERQTEALEHIATSLSGNSGKQTDPQTDSMTAGEVEPTIQVVEKEACKIDQPATVGELMTTLRAEGKSYEKIANALEAAGFPTVSGRGRWRGQTVKRELIKLGVVG